MLAFLLTLGLSLGPQDPGDAAGLTATLLEKKDEAEPELVRRLANLRTPEALDGLIQAYDSLASLYLRLAVVRSLSLFDGLEGANQRALQELLDIATLSPESELREAAVDTIADCPQLGPTYLERIVESAADDSLRERALRLHLGSSRPEDAEWYRRIWRPREGEGSKKPAKGKKDDASAEARVSSPALRELAFEGLARGLTPDELVKATEEKLPTVRRLALEELASRRVPQALDVAEHLYGNREERPRTRLVAAGLLLADKGPRYGERLLKEASRGEVPLELSFGIADLLSALKDPKLEALVQKGLGQGQPAEKLFYLRAGKALEDPKVDKALLELSQDRDLSVRLETVRIMGERGHAALVPRLTEILEEAKEDTLLAATFDALARIEGSDPAWLTRLVVLARSDRELLRNAALQAIGRTRNRELLPVLIAALDHDDWSTRLAAAQALEVMHIEAAVGALCERLGKEQGRLSVELSEILWRLTGQPFRADPVQWKRWWEKEGTSFRIPSAAELQQREAEREKRRLKQVTKSSTFFGVRVLSQRVSFVVDVSGSMEERVPGEKAGDKGATRLEVAKRELLSCLDALDASTSFNVIPFSSGVSPWKPEATERTGAILTEARDFVQRLGALGGTNIYGALQAAFADPSVDTIYFLSDGEPSVGDLIDPLAIRRAVQSWNEHRGVVLHTISIGDRFPLLEWLAEDSGGTHTTFP